MTTTQALGLTLIILVLAVTAGIIIFEVRRGRALARSIANHPAGRGRA